MSGIQDMLQYLQEKMYFYICYSLDNQMKVHIVLFSSTVIFTAVSYHVFNSHYLTFVFVYM